MAKAVQKIRAALRKAGDCQTAASAGVGLTEAARGPCGRWHDARAAHGLYGHGRRSEPVPHRIRSADHAMQIRHLEQAKQHVAQGERHIAEQKERVARLSRRGHNVTEARKLLNNFYASQAFFIQHRHQIEMELEQ